MKKSFPTLDVATVATGIMLRKGADFQGVMDHFYPGIFTIGCAAMHAEGEDSSGSQIIAGARIMPPRNPLCQTYTQSIFAEEQRVVMPQPHSDSSQKKKVRFGRPSKTPDRTGIAREPRVRSGSSSIGCEWRGSRWDSFHIFGRSVFPMWQKAVLEFSYLKVLRFWSIDAIANS